MEVITKYALYEKLRRKELYIVSALCVLILLLLSSGSTELTVAGEPVTGFNAMFPVLHTVANALSCLFAAVLSCGTIPQEYERHSSHLVWARGISQPVYHGGLALANLIASCIPALIQYVLLAGYAVLNGHSEVLGVLLPAFLILTVNIGVVSLFTSAVSIPLPEMPAGVIGVLLALVGIFHGLLEMYGRVIGGVPSTLLNAVLTVIPNLYKIGGQAENLLLGKEISVHVLLVGLLAVYIGTALIWALRKKEA